MRVLLGSAVLAMLCFAGRAAEEPGKDPPAPSRARTDQILARLGLSDEQVAKIDALFAEYGAKAADLYKELVPKGTQPDKATLAKIHEKEKALAAERDGKIREQLTAEQQTRFDIARKLIADQAEKSRALHREKAEAMRGADPEKRRGITKMFNDKQKALVEGFSRQMDEKVGKLPEGLRKYHPLDAPPVRKSGPQGQSG